MSTTFQTIATMIGLTSTAWLSGNISALSLISIPAITTASTTTTASTKTPLPPTLKATLFHKTYNLGKAQNPPIAILSTVCLTYLSWSTRHLPGSPIVGLGGGGGGVMVSCLFGVAAVATVGIVPFTVVFMRGVNGLLIRVAEGKVGAKVGEEREEEVDMDMDVDVDVDVDELLWKWRVLNGIRGLLPLIGAVAAGIAVVC